jgi:hypothetical protein
MFLIFPEFQILTIMKLDLISPQTAHTHTLSYGHD